MLQLEINRLNEETNVMDAQVALREKMQSMRSFLGLEQTQNVRLRVPDEVPAFEVPLQQAMNLALENSPDPDYYRRVLKESESRLSQARANAGLKVDLYAQFGLSQTGPDIGAVYRNPMNQQSVSITIALPILDWGRGKGRVREAKSQLALTRTQVEQGMRDFCQNVEKLVLQFNMQARKVRVASLTDQRAEKDTWWHEDSTSWGATQFSTSMLQSARKTLRDAIISQRCRHIGAYTICSEV